MGWLLFPEPDFELPVADPGAPLSAVTLRWDERFTVDATLAADFPVVAWRPRADTSLAFGVEAAGRMGFFPEPSLRFNLETFDGTFGFPVSFRWGPWAARLDLAHTSAHYADGAAVPDGVVPDQVAYSREWVRLLGSRALGPARVYAGARLLVHDVRDAPPLALQVGGEVAGPWRVAPFLAVDLQLAEESAWAPALSGQAGVWLRPGAGARLRLALAGRVGPEDTGRLSGRDEAWIGLTIGFDRTGRLVGANHGEWFPPASHQ